MRHIFLTGDKQTGKSTILRALLAGRAHTGFRTEPFELHGRKAGYTLHSLTPLPPMENDCPCVIRVGEMRHTAVDAVFDGAGAQALRQALASEIPLILMDELGKAERHASAFLAAVQDCLDDPAHHVIGVVQRGDAPMQRHIRERADVMLIEVTPENRAEALRQAEEAIRGFALDNQS